jgi:hypothetical protein
MLRQSLSFLHRLNDSVHTSKATLAQGEAEINRIGHRLRAAGRL